MSERALPCEVAAARQEARERSGGGGGGGGRETSPMAKVRACPSFPFLAHKRPRAHFTYKCKCWRFSMQFCVDWSARLCSTEFKPNHVGNKIFFFLSHVMFLTGL